MRFREIKKFKVDELLLDEGNYRFIAARNQKACVEKIYLSNTQYFKNLMSSVAEDDLGEPLLVYQHANKNVVLDGNRRLAALKVLKDPEKYAPSDSVKEYAEAILAKHTIAFSDIHAQVSQDKNLIYKTVYERHAAGHGKSRINWSAYGAARFRYDLQMEEGNEWYSIALLLETEAKYPEWTGFIDSSAYSHEVFRRVIRSALEKGVISRSIFSDRNQRIKTSVDKKLIKDAIDKVHQFLHAMQNKDLSLSREGKYADKKSVDKYMEGFSMSPDNARSKAPAGKGSKSAASGSSTSSSNSAQSSTTDSGTSSTGTNTAKDKQGFGIERSTSIEQKLAALKSKKLIGLYNSLCVVSLSQHPQLLYAGAWSFFESLSTLLGKTEGTSFDSFLGSKMNDLGYSRQDKKDFNKPLKDISDTGNLNKHSGTYHSTTALQLRADFTTLEPLIIALIDMQIAKKKAP